MNPALPIPALLMKSRRNVVDHFNRAGATSAETAVTYIPNRQRDRDALAYLTRRGIVSLADGGRYWVDTDAASKWEKGNKTKMAVAIGGAMAAVAAVLAMTR